MSIRKSTVAGMFYPDECHELKHYIDHFSAQMPPCEEAIVPKALIVPHAGYIYSGYTANLAYFMASKRTDIKRVVVIGPSHRVYLNGASIALFETYQTPCANLEIDVDFAQNLKQKYPFLGFFHEAHEEHSTETQMPLIQHYFPHAKVVEIVYGDIAYDELSILIDEVLCAEQTLVVISTDLSHFHTQEVANKLDMACIDAIKNLNLKAFEGCEACGLTGVKSLVQSAINNGLKPHFLDYHTSYDRTKDASRVVGYTSFILG